MNGTTALRHSISGSGIGEPFPIATLVVYKDDAGYGMKVSGDKPVYVQSVKEGGAAERAGLHAGDEIIKVNGLNVTQSTHTEVVKLIKSSVQVVLTVQQKSVSTMSTGLSPSQHHRPTSLSTSSVLVSPVGATSLHRASTAPASCTERITGPQPVDLEKRRQLETQRVLTLQLMLEDEQNYVEKIRSDLAKAAAGGGNANNIAALQTKLANAERRLKSLQEPLDQLCPLVNQHALALSSSGGGGSGDAPPPLPSRKSLSTRSLSPPPLPPRPPPNSQNVVQSEMAGHLTPPIASGIPNSFSQGANLGSSSKHQRTKSSPEQLGIVSPAEASRRLIASESMNELSPGSRPGRHSGIDLDDPTGASHRTPPGTPPPPYPAPMLGDSCSSCNESLLDNFNAVSSPRSQSVLDGSNPGMPMIQQPIMSMEDDDMSDQEVGQLEDHGPFKLLSRLWQHHAHLAVFMNYVLSNSNPSSLLFYLITEVYKEGNAKEMRKWAYEIHSSFLVPGAPLRLHNVDENVAREIDNVLLNESDKEEILRKIFWKARNRAKEELNEQLTDFQQKRIAGLGTLFGPSDAQLDESASDKSKETKIIETYLLPKMETYLDEIEKENARESVEQRKFGTPDAEKENDEQRRFATAASLATVLTKVFQVRSISLDRVPTFVAKDKSHIKAKLIAAKARKMAVRGHHFVAHQYFTVTYCNHCQHIIGGIGPQGYQCGNCTLNVHRQCVRIVEENCPGPLVRKEKGISKLMERIRPEKKPPTPHHSQNQMHHIERIKRGEEDSSPLADGENGEHRGSGPAGSARSGSERGRVSGFGGGDHADSMDDPSSREDISEMVQQNISSKPKTSNINRSESYKERIHKRQLREKRKTSDPNLSKTNDCDASGAFPGNSAGSSSNSSLSTRSLDSPSTSLEQVHPATAGANASASWDSDVDVEPDPPDWSQGVAEEVLARLGNAEKKRQEVINELFHTERSHVRALKVLSQVFHKPLLETQVLPPDQIHLLFSNLDEMVTLHSQFNQAMKRRKKENPCVGDIGDLLLEMFDGEAGEIFERAASKYCAKQQVALRALRDQRRKDPKLNSFLNEVEANPLCRRLQLKDHILTGMLRLTKYPLLFDNLAKYTSEQNEKEKAAVLRSLERSREILSRVNQAVREAEDYHRLAEIQHTIDRSAFDKFEHPTVQEFKNLDITKRRLIYEGPLQWRVVAKAKPVDLHVVLLDDTILLLHRQDEKYALKFINQTNQSNAVLSPIVRVSTVLVRHNAVDKNSLYLVNTSQNGAQIYDLVASSSEERKLWCKHISEAAEVHKSRDREGRRPMPPSSSSTDLVESSEEQLLPEPSSAQTQENSNETRAAEKLEQDKRKDSPVATIDSPTVATAPTQSSPRPQPQPTETTDAAAVTTEDDEAAAATAASEEGAAGADPVKPGLKIEGRRKLPEPEEGVAGGASPVAGLAGIAGTTSTGEPLRLLTCTQSSLIDPIEVHVEERPVHVAEPVLTPIESLRRKDEVIKQALLEKQSIVENILNIPKTEVQPVTETVSELPAVEKEPSELILAAIGQANQLIELLNSALTVSETETVLATQTESASDGCKATGCPTPRVHPRTLEPAIPVSTLQPFCNSLTSQLSQLLKIVKERDEERERLRKELRRSRERLHAVDAEAQRRETPEVPSASAEIETQTEHPIPAVTTDDEVNQPTSYDGPNKEIFVDAQSEPEASTVTTEPVEEVKVASDNEVMGDSVG
ncbi:rho guanine nucleotide exchange factor 12 isoform X2 [Nasonia vitripennis]|uniref:Rho guanine nucleotide exchange factor 12 n=1 Tax=Nasonia vitripennis TaxID=7425 RepID=A0A7M7QIN1_NASVI|nr:rho guanine nucleotide exchange factor 12 isoform X2 [Nasonia vitripennis]